jgi:NADH-quinone oxidoreductase subunit N
MLVFLFSLAGIPPLGGFMAKFYVFMALLEGGFTGLAVFAVIMSAVAAYYYIRIVMLMYMKEGAGVMEAMGSRAISFTLLAALVATVVFGIAPGYFMEIAEVAGASSAVR